MIVDRPIGPADHVSIPVNCGGLVVFNGIVRDHNHGKRVLRLEYECYLELADSEIRTICLEARTKFQTCGESVVHRIGTMEPGDTAIMIQVWSAHRRECFEACSYIIDEIKHRVPIWKKEFYEDNTYSWALCTHSHGESGGETAHL